MDLGLHFLGGDGIGRYGTSGLPDATIRPNGTLALLRSYQGLGNVFFTAGSCGPCRFGMYEAEYRFALKNAGFDGFRVLLFKDSDGIKAASGEPGLKFTVDFGFGMLNAMHLGDVINDLIYQIRPFEVNKGETDRVFREMVDGLCDDLRKRKSFEIEQCAPDWAKPSIFAPRPKLT